MNLQKLYNPDFWIEKSCNDLYFLCRSMLMTLDCPKYGYQDLYYPTHKLICNFIEQNATEGQHCILLTPRHWIKSYIVTVGWSIQRALKRLQGGLRETNLITNATYTNAVEFLKKIKFNFKYNDFLRGIYSHVIPDVFSTDKEEELEINGHRICTGAVEKNLVSQHYYTIIHDDLVNKENSETKQQLEKVHDWWSLAQNLLHPRGIEIIIGTRWNYDDLYGMLIEKFIKPEKNYDVGKPIVELHKDNWHLLQIDCWEDSKERAGSTFPTLFSESKLKELEVQLGDRFYGQMENRPYKSGRNPFKSEWFVRYHRHSIPDVRYTALLIDPSGKAKGGDSSYTGISVVHFSADKKVYIEFGKRFLITDVALAEKTIELALMFYPDTIGIEDVKYQAIKDMLSLLIEQKIRHGELTDEQIEFLKQVPGMMIELKPRGRPKTVRIKQLSGYIETGQYMFPYKGTEDLEDELLRFPSTKDDVVDSLAYSLDILFFPKKDELPKILVVPDKLKMTTEERLKEEWENMEDEMPAGIPPASGFAELELY